MHGGIVSRPLVFSECLLVFLAPGIFFCLGHFFFFLSPANALDNSGGSSFFLLPRAILIPPLFSSASLQERGGEELRGLFWSRISPAPLPASLAISPPELLTLANSRPSTFFCFVRSFSSSLLPLRQREDGRGEGESGGTLPSFCLLLPPLSKQLSRKKSKRKGPAQKSKLPTGTPPREAPFFPFSFLRAAGCALKFPPLPRRRLCK